MLRALLQTLSARVRGRQAPLMPPLPWRRAVDKLGPLWRAEAGGLTFTVRLVPPGIGRATHRVRISDADGWTLDDHYFPGSQQVGKRHAHEWYCKYAAAQRRQVLATHS